MDDATNPFAGGLPPPPDEGSDDEDDNLDDGNPFNSSQPPQAQQPLQDEKDDDDEDRNLDNGHVMSQPKPVFDATNPFSNDDSNLPSNHASASSSSSSSSASKSAEKSQKTIDKMADKTDKNNADDDDNEPEPEPDPEPVLSAEQEKEARRQRNRVRAVNELITTETTYVFKLLMLHKLYINPLRNANDKLLKRKFHAILFPVILPTMLELNKKLLQSMQKNRAQIGRSMLDFIPYLKMYQNYMNNHESASRLIRKLRRDAKGEFAKYLVAHEQKDNGFTLESYLILPIQRMPRYELCLKEILKLTHDDHDDRSALAECFAKVAAVNKQINVRMKDYETRQKVHEIELRIFNLDGSGKSGANLQQQQQPVGAGGQGQQHRLVTPSRIFMKHGHLTKISRKKHIRYLFILFNDLLLYCSESGVNDKLMLHQRIDLTDRYFRIESMSEVQNSCMYKYDNNNNNKARLNTFEIHSIQKSFLCYADTEAERAAWIDAIEKCLDVISRSGIANKHMSRTMQVNPHTSARKSLHLKRDAGDGDDKQEEEEDGDRILETAPIWIPNDWTDECMLGNCRKKFGALLFKRKNHCYYCGKLVCNDCTTHTLPHYDPQKRRAGVHVKVCDVCYDKYRVKPLMSVAQLSIAHQKLASGKSSAHAAAASCSIKRPSLSQSLSKNIEEMDEELISSSDWNGMYEQSAVMSSFTPSVSVNTLSAAQSQPQAAAMAAAAAGFPVSLPQSFTPVSMAMAEPTGDVFMFQQSQQQQQQPQQGQGLRNGELEHQISDSLLLSKEGAPSEEAKHDDNEPPEVPEPAALAVNPELKQKEQKEEEDLYSFMDGAADAGADKDDNKASQPAQKKEDDDPMMHFDENHDNVKQLSMFGFTPKNVRDAWKLMKRNGQHKSIVPDHGPLFMETMLEHSIFSGQI